MAGMSGQKNTPHMRGVLASPKRKLTQKFTSITKAVGS